MSGNTMIPVHAKVLKKNSIALQVEIDGKTGWLKVSVIEIEQDFNSIEPDQYLQLQVPEWHLINAGLR